ncbi:dihydroorotate dehydrogenase electron transfer subunit [Candidatus Margulisiibacteriota bacterium]
MKRNPLYKIKENTLIQGPYYLLVLEGFPQSQPGQFVNILCQKDGSFLLRRPFSINRVIGNDIYIIYKAIGRGTEMLAGHKAGELIDAIGPLGKGWQLNAECGKTHILVGGGIGIAPLLGFADTLAQKEEKVVILLGGRSKIDILCEKEFRELGCDVRVTTDDGSYGEKGLVTNLLDRILEDNSEFRIPNSAFIYTCGPHPMMKKVAEIAARLQIPCQVSLEEMMGCGLGGCVCCVCETKQGYEKVCTEGPVFNSDEIVW